MNFTDTACAHRRKLTGQSKYKYAWCWLTVWYASSLGWLQWKNINSEKKSMSQTQVKETSANVVYLQSWANHEATWFWAPCILPWKACYSLSLCHFLLYWLHICMWQFSLLSFLNHFGVWAHVSGLFLPPLFCGFAFLCGGFPPGVI